VDQRATLKENSLEIQFFAFFFGTAAGFHLKDTFVEVNTHGHTHMRIRHSFSFVFKTSTPQVPQNERTKGPDPMIKSMFQAGDTLVSFACLCRCCHRQCYFCCFLLVVLRVSQDTLVYVCQSVTGRAWVCVCVRQDTQIPRYLQMKPPNPGEFNARPGRRTKLCLHWLRNAHFQAPCIFRPLACRGKLCRLLIYYENATFI